MADDDYMAGWHGNLHRNSYSGSAFVGAFARDRAKADEAEAAKARNSSASSIRIADLASPTPNSRLAGRLLGLAVVLGLGYASYSFYDTYRDHRDIAAHQDKEASFRAHPVEIRRATRTYSDWRLTRPTDKTVGPGVYFFDMVHQTYIGQDNSQNGEVAMITDDFGNTVYVRANLDEMRPMQVGTPCKGRSCPW